MSDDLDPTAQLLDAATEAAELGDEPRRRSLLCEAARLLAQKRRFSEAIDLYVRAFDFASAARTAAEAGDRGRAEELEAMMRPRAPTPATQSRPGAPVRVPTAPTPPARIPTLPSPPARTVTLPGPLAQASGSAQPARMATAPPAASPPTATAESAPAEISEERGIELAVALESRGELARAADLYERHGDPISAGRALVDAARALPKDQLIARRALVIRASRLHEMVGQIDRATVILEEFGLRNRAREVLRRAGRAEEAEAIPPQDEDEAPLRPPSIKPTPSRIVVGAPVSAGESWASTPERAYDQGQALLARARKGERALFEKAIEALLPIPPSSKLHLAAQAMIAGALSEIGKPREAVKLLRRALRGIEYDADHLPLLYEYARILEREGLDAEARGTYRIIADISPTYMDVSQRLKDLERS